MNTLIAWLILYPLATQIEGFISEQRIAKRSKFIPAKFPDERCYLWANIANTIMYFSVAAILLAKAQ